MQIYHGSRIWTQVEKRALMMCSKPCSTGLLRRAPLLLWFSCWFVAVYYCAITSVQRSAKVPEVSSWCGFWKPWNCTQHQLSEHCDLMRIRIDIVQLGLTQPSHRNTNFSQFPLSIFFVKVMIFQTAQHWRSIPTPICISQMIMCLGSLQHNHIRSCLAAYFQFARSTMIEFCVVVYTLQEAKVDLFTLQSSHLEFARKSKQTLTVLLNASIQKSQLAFQTS